MNQLPRALLRQRVRLGHRPISTFPTRHLSQYIASNGQGPIRVQAVRIGQPGFFQNRNVALKRLVTVFLYGTAAFLYLQIVARHLEIEIEGDGEEDGKEGEVAEGEGSEQDTGPPYYADDESLFIPMTWATKLPKTWYRGTDPEWQEFVKFARDPERRKKVQTELVQIIFTRCTQHPALAKELGKDKKLSKSWTDIQFPDAPPQEYMRSGIEVGDGFIAWSQQKVTPENHFRLMRAIWPQATLSSLWASTKVLAGIQYRRVMQTFGLAEKDPRSPEERYRIAMEMIQKQQKKKQKALGNTQTDPNGEPGAVGSTSSSQMPGDSRRFPWQISVPLPKSDLANGTDLPIATHVFRHALSRSWGAKNREPPRGTFVVQAFVEIRGQKSRALLDCQGFYDPKTSEFVFIEAALRNIKQFAQAPKGGR